MGSLVSKVEKFLIFESGGVEYGALSGYIKIIRVEYFLQKY